jgi:hypothetical protein
MNSTRKFVFGIYPGGEAGSDKGMAFGPPDDPARITAHLDVLQGESRPFVVRAYERYSDADNPSKWPAQAPRDYEQYCHPERPLDLVVMFQSVRGNVAGYLEFLRTIIRRHARRLYSLQVTEEANFIGGPDCIDGCYPEARQALVQGVIAAREELNLLGGQTVKVGFNSTPTFGPGADFWTGIGQLGGDRFRASVDYVGLDFFPDVFRPAADVSQVVLFVLETMRRDWLPAAGIGPAVPIHIAENGWPTGPARSYERQAQVLETVIRTVHGASHHLNIERYTLFSLRDADSTNPKTEGDIFHHFGITRDDYTPKPAFKVFRSLIAEFRSLQSI